MAGTFTRCSGSVVRSLEALGEAKTGQIRINTVMTLLEHGADINAKNAAGEASFSLLQANGLFWHLPTQRD
ncbi:hypothetical protein CDV31_014837 [Fusarium ambrosium]|uniref:Uncharacterized protein n=1 Tax=Fusarium ambrosium TaxID=131363 RepID=A0A428SU22_9HYPO|nr:hypothetical protein CDV31_014837 [Fusarium ambrosium]